MISERSYSSESDLSENHESVESAASGSHAFPHIQSKILSALRHSTASDPQIERNTRIKRMEFLPEVDDELDYNEDELPVVQRDHATQDMGRAQHSSRLLIKGRLTVNSPREEGEEYSEDDDESYSQSDIKRTSRSDKGRSRTEREEGEASSEDERRYSHHTRHARTGRSLTTTSTTTNLLLDEAHYRNRLQERYERREAKRSRMGNIKNELNSRVSSVTVETQFAIPRSKMDTSPYSTGEYANPTGPIPSELDRRWRVQRSGSSDKGSSRHRIPEESSELGGEYPDDRRSSRKHGKSDKKISEQESRSKSKRDDRDRSPKPNQVPRSYSTSYLGYEQVSGQFDARLEDADQKMPPEPEFKKSKSKKSKRDRSERDHERNEYRMHKKSSKLPKVHSYYELEPKSLEVSKYEKEFTIEPLKKGEVGTGLGERENYSSASSRSSSSSSSGSHSPSPNTRPSDSRKHRSRHGISHPKTNLEYLHKKHKHKHQRDVRESAPPPDAMRTQNMMDATSRVLPPSSRASKQSKHKLDDSHQTDSQLATKRSRHLPEGHGEPVITDKRNAEDGSRRSISDTRPSRSDSQDRRIIDTVTNSDDSNRSTLRLSHAAIAGYPHAFSSNDSSGSESGDSTGRSVHEVGDEDTSSTHREGGKPLDRDVPVSRRTGQLPLRSTNPYRLYSESESEDEHDNDHVESSDLTKEDGALRSQDLDDLNGENNDGTIVNGTSRLLSPIHNKPFYFPSIQGCRSVEEFECLNRIEEGTYGVVYRARDKKTNEIVALKRLKMEKERDGFPITSLREINTLMKAQHENIVTVREIVVGSNMDKIYLVMDYVEHDLKSLMEVMNGPFSVGEVKCLLVQLLRAVRHLHDNWILHRDLKTSNLLLSHQGILKVGDFGLAREYGSPLKHYTEVVVTLWYRAPELLLGTKQYTCPIDMWSVGCIFAEFLLQRPLFPGKGEVDELNIIFRDLGTPTERIWPGVSQLPGMKKCVFTDYPYNQLRRRFTEKQISDQGFDLLNSFLTYCPEKRITAEKALTHAYFNERPRAIHPSMFPSWPAKSEGAVTVRKASPRPPAGGGALAAAAAAMAAATAATAAAGGSGRVRYQPPAPPMGGQRFYSSMGIGGGPDSRSGTAIGSGDLLSSGPDKGFLLRF